MVLQRRRNIGLQDECIKELVKEYFTIVRMLYPNFCGLNISEMFRYSICRLLNLDTRGYHPEIERYAIPVCNLLSVIVNKYCLASQPLSYRMGVLEACVHCLEMARKRAGV